MNPIVAEIIRIIKQSKDSISREEQIWHYIVPNRSPETTELIKLRKENQKLKMENDILSKQR